MTVSPLCLIVFSLSEHELFQKFVFETVQYKLIKNYKNYKCLFILGDIRKSVGFADKVVLFCGEGSSASIEAHWLIETATFPFQIKHFYDSLEIRWFF